MLSTAHPSADITHWNGGRPQEGREGVPCLPEGLCAQEPSACQERWAQGFSGSPRGLLPGSSHVLSLSVSGF